MAEIRLRVEVDSEKMKAVEDALTAFDKKQQELRQAIGDVQTAVYDLQDAVHVKREVD